jgi:hypothetical protein
MIKTYTVSHGPTWWECQIGIDDSPETVARIMEMVEFWSDWKSRLETNEGDYIKTFLQDLAREIQYIIAEHDYNLTGVIEEFINREGWCLMDGTFGIEILNVDEFEFTHSEYEVLEDPIA